MSNTNQNDANSPNDVMEYFTPQTPAETTSPDDTNATNETTSPSPDIETPSPNYSPSHAPVPAPAPAPAPVPQRAWRGNHQRTIMPPMDFQIEMFLTEMKNYHGLESNKDCRTERFNLIMEKLTEPLVVLAHKVQQYSTSDTFKVREIEINWKGTDVRLFEEKNGVKIRPDKFKFGIIVRMYLRECDEDEHQRPYTIENMLNGHKRKVAQSMAFSCPFKMINIEIVVLKFIENYGDLISRWVYHTESPLAALFNENENRPRSSRE